MRTLPLDIGTIHFVGIGGIGMSGIAEIMQTLGYRVQGSDLADNANVGRLREHGVSIEVHGWQHARMDGMPRSELTRQLSDCRRALRERLGHESVALAYPFGAWDAGCVAAARDAGFEFACTTAKRVADLERDDPFELPRLPVRGYRWIHELRFRGALWRASS